MFPPIFVADTIITCGYNFVAPLNILNLSGESQNIILNCNTVIPSLFSYVPNIIGLICDCFLLRFDLLFWNEIDKNMPIWKRCFAFWIRGAIQTHCATLKDWAFRYVLFFLSLKSILKKSLLSDFSPLFLQLKNHY